MKAVFILTDLYGQTMSLFYNFEYSHPGPRVDHAKQTTGIRHIVESLPNAFSSISNEQLPKPYNISIRSKVVIAIYHQGGQSTGMIDKSWDISPPNMFRTFEFCGSAEYWNGII